MKTKKRVSVTYQKIEFAPDKEDMQQGVIYISITVCFLHPHIHKCIELLYVSDI